MDLFFVLSAFLLTLALLQGPQTHSVWRFWQRRAARILPAYWLQLLVLCAAAFVSASSGAMAWTPEGGALLAHASLYLNLWPTVTPALGVWWSLPVEVMFYLLLPLLLPSLRSNAVRFLLIALLVGIGLRWLLAASELPHLQKLIWSDTFPARCHQFAIGMWGAWLWLHRHRMTAAWSALGIDAAIMVSLIVLLALPALGLLGAEGKPFWGAVSTSPLSLLWHALLAMIALALMCLLACGKGIVARLLSLSPLRYLGRISFGLYLWHYPALWTVQQQWGREATLQSPLLFLLAGIALSVVLAALSWHGLEEPILRRVRATRVAE